METIEEIVAKVRPTEKPRQKVFKHRMGSAIGAMMARGVPPETIARELNIEYGVLLSWIGKHHHELNSTKPRPMSDKHKAAVSAALKAYHARKKAKPDRLAQLEKEVAELRAKLAIVKEALEL